MSRKPPPRRRRRMRRAVWPALVSVVFVGVLFTAVFPTRTFLAQRAATNSAEEKLRVLGEENELLEARIARLHSDEELERIAREQYHLVRPGEEAYAVLPPAEEPEAGTEDEADEKKEAVDRAARDESEKASVVRRAWEVLTSWL